MKRAVFPLMLAFGVALAVMIGQRMSTDAMTVVVGVAVGVAASVPTSLLLVALLRKERRTWQQEPKPPEPQPYPQLQQPNVIVLNPNDYGAKQDPYQQVPQPPLNFGADGGMRQLRVVGDDDDWG
jgi:hypothetical protein